MYQGLSMLINMHYTFVTHLETHICNLTAWHCQFLLLRKQKLLDKISSAATISFIIDSFADYFVSKLTDC